MCGGGVSLLTSVQCPGRGGWPGSQHQPQSESGELELSRAQPAHTQPPLASRYIATYLELFRALYSLRESSSYFYNNKHVMCSQSNRCSGQPRTFACCRQYSRVSYPYPWSVIMSMLASTSVICIDYGTWLYRICIRRSCLYLVFP